MPASAAVCSFTKQQQNESDMILIAFSMVHRVLNARFKSLVILCLLHRKIVSQGKDTSLGLVHLCKVACTTVKLHFANENLNSVEMYGLAWFAKGKKRLLTYQWKIRVSLSPDLFYNLVI